MALKLSENSAETKVSLGLSISCEPVYYLELWRPSNPPLIANAGFESTLRPHLTLIIHNLTKEFLRSARSEVKLAGIFCATLRWSGVMLSQVVPQFPQMGGNCAVWYHTLASSRNYHILPVGRDTAIWPGHTIRQTTDNTRIFTRFQFNWRPDHIWGGILHFPNWRPFEFLSGHIFVFIDTEFVTLKFFYTALVWTL